VLARGLGLLSLPIDCPKPLHASDPQKGSGVMNARNHVAHGGCGYGNG
jgi:hypothetical protein